MDPIFEPIFDFSENMAGHPFGFSKPQTYFDEMLRQESEFDTFRILRSIFGDKFPFSTDLFPDNLPRPYWRTPRYITPVYPKKDFTPFPSDLFSDSFLRPFWMAPGYTTPVSVISCRFSPKRIFRSNHILLKVHPRRDYILDQEPGPSLSDSFRSSSTYFSDSNGQHYESIKSSIKRQDGVIINKEIVRKNGREVTTTTTLYPDGRQESKTETNENTVLADTPSGFLPPAENIFREDDTFPNLRRWFGF
ncbi:unnamed protein product [Hydatigera taeniaeformis]|uniref:Uncharacterized protein n=1 Tax=Hydatigena taeniaeformis TaxID=6205 RepID=A0A0R3X6K7_HYDTA|nr:unnamed protein product [Hydatigera taeniaeformis]